MREKKDIRVNRIPSPTWRWLSLNEHLINEVELPASVSAGIDLSNTVALKELPAFTLEGIKTGMGSDYCDMLSLSTAPVHSFKSSGKSREKASAVIEIEFDDCQSQCFMAQLEVSDGAEMTAVMDIGTEE